jgi:trehalose synthase
LGNTSLVPQTSRVESLPIDPRRLEPLIGTERLEALVRTAATLRELLDGRRIVNVNSTATGGGVAEMLATLIGYVRGVGLEAEWLVISGSPDFFAVTKRIHNGLYGSPGDGGDLGATERGVYDRTTAANLHLLQEIGENDVVIIHDPQPAGLIGPLTERGTTVIWRCHVGYDGANEWTDRAWEFLRPIVTPAHAHVFSREAFAPAFVDRAAMRVIPPSIDPFTPKNVDIGPQEVLELLSAAGLISANGMRPDSRIAKPSQVVREGPPPGPEVPLVVQVSRWDRMKDMIGVLEGFVRYVDRPGTQLVLAGPAVTGVSDDPEGEEVWNETLAAWKLLPAADRARVQLAAVPMDDPVANAYVINALQRHAAVVVQKSLAEGFGLTVAEAMWKARPVVASAVGGIVDQVVDGETGLLVADPNDLDSFGAAVERLLRDGDEAERMARNGRAHIGQHFLGDRHLLQYAELLSSLLGREPAPPG